MTTTNTSRRAVLAGTAIRCDGDSHADIDEENEEGAQMHWSVLALGLVRRSIALIAGAGGSADGPAPDLGGSLVSGDGGAVS